MPLTYQNTKGSSAPVAPAGVAGAPEIQITQAMIEAGAKVLMREDVIHIGPMTAEVIAEEILQHALAARRVRTC